MSARLKVYGGLVHTRGMQRRTIVAATSIPKAAVLIGTTPYDMRTYWSVTGNKVEVAIAMAQPGQVFQSSDRCIGSLFRPVALQNGVLVPVAA